MSTHLETINGRYEQSSSGTFEVNYEKAELDITRFFGGKENGAMLQLTIISDKIAYIQLTKEQVKELASVLKNSFNKKIYPSE